MNLINSYRRKNGFTLVELIVVIAIIAILAAAIAPNLSWFVNDANEADMIAQGKVVLINIEDEVANLRKTTETTEQLEVAINQEDKRKAILEESDLMKNVDINSFVIQIENRQLYYFEYAFNNKYICYNDGEVYVNKTSQADSK